MQQETKTELTELRNSGFNIVTGYKDEKRPNMQWKKWQTEFVPEGIFKQMLVKGDWADTSGHIHKGTGGTGIYCMITGEVSNVIVLDVDSIDVYNEFFKEYEDKTVVVETPSGGKHLWFRVKTYSKNITGYNGFPIDVKSNGGQVVVPPSTTDAGDYVFIKKSGLRPMEINDIADVLSRIPKRDDTSLSDALKKFYNKVAGAGHDLRSIMEGNGIKDFEGGAHGVYKCECMFHSSQNPHKALEIYNTGTYYCHGCSATGDMVDMVRALKDCSFRDAITYLEKLSGVSSGISYTYAHGEDVPYTNKDFYKFKTLANGESVYAGLNAEKIAEYLIDKFHVILSTSGHLYCYDSDVGIYVRADHKISTMTSEIWDMFGNLATITQTREIMHAVDGITHKRCVVDIEKAFIHRDKICFKNGVYNTETDELVPHSYEVPFISQLDVVYDNTAACPNIDKFMAETFKDVEDELEWIGYCMAVGNRLERVSFYVGGPRTGKSTYLNMLGDMFGSTSAAHIDPHSFKSDVYAFNELHGKSVNIAPDISTSPIRGDNTVKLLSGEDWISAPVKYENRLDFRNMSKSSFGCNSLPSFGGLDPAIGRRVRVVVCDNAHTVVDPNYEDRLTTDNEKSGLANRALAGMSTLIERGKFVNDGDIEEYEAVANQPKAFVEAFLDITGSDDDRMYTKTIYDAYEEWATRKGYPLLSRRQFTPEFKMFVGKYGVEKKKIKGGQAFHGIRFTEGYFETRGVGVL